MRARIADHPANAGVLRYLADGADPSTVSIERPTAETDTWRLGAHPDVVEHLWKTLNGALPADGRILLAGGAAVANPRSGELVAVALGTQYAVRLSPAAFDEAVGRGHETAHTFGSVGRSLDLATTFGARWVFGRYDADERRWIAESGGVRS
jgi:hypothetical protein